MGDSLKPTAFSFCFESIFAWASAANEGIVFRKSSGARKAPILSACDNCVKLLVLRLSCSVTSFFGQHEHGHNS